MLALVVLDTGWGKVSPSFLPRELGKVPDSPLKHEYLNSTSQSVDKLRGFHRIPSLGI